MKLPLNDFDVPINAYESPEAATSGTKSFQRDSISLYLTAKKRETPRRPAPRTHECRSEAKNSVGSKRKETAHIN